MNIKKYVALVVVIACTGCGHYDKYTSLAPQLSKGWKAYIYDSALYRCPSSRACVSVSSMTLEIKPLTRNDAYLRDPKERYWVFINMWDDCRWACNTDDIELTLPTMTLRPYTVSEIVGDPLEHGCKYTFDIPASELSSFHIRFTRGSPECTIPDVEVERESDWRYTPFRLIEMW